jgi:flagellar biosynthetic protein FliR
MDHSLLPALIATDPAIAAGVLVRMAVAVAAGGLGMFPQVDVRVKSVMALVLAAAALPTAVATAPAASPALAVFFVSEAVVGAGLGLVVAMVFTAASWAGGIAASVSGLSWADDWSLEAATGDGSAARLAGWLAVAGFLATGGHLAVIAGLVESVGRLPVGGFADGGRGGLVETVVAMPAAALELAWALAVPAVAAVLTFHLAVAICLRSIRFTVGAGLLQAAASLVLVGALLQGVATWTEGFAAAARGSLERAFIDIHP